jgi:MFS family permease
MNSISTYQAYLSTHQLRDYSDSSTGWIFSIYIALTFLCGIFVGPIFDAKGSRVLVLVGSILMMLSIMLMGVCTGNDSERQHCSSLTNLMIRILSIPACFRYSWGIWNVLGCHSSYYSHWSFLQHHTWLRHWYRLHWRVRRGYCLPTDARSSFP